MAESRAQRNVGRLLRFLVVVGALAGLVWLAFSPWLSVNQVKTAGIAASNANQVLAAHAVVAGTPMMMIRAGAVEADLLTDPWIRDARVYKNWPDEVVVRVIERVPVAWVETADGWSRHSVDGAALPSPGTPDSSLPWVHLPEMSDGDIEGSPYLFGAVQFSSALAAEYRDNASLRVDGEELWASVQGYEVRLGRPVEMESKALSLAALLTENIDKSATIVLIAPTHPAISPAGAGEESTADREEVTDQPSPEETGP